MIANKLEVLKLFDFQSEDDFYLVQIISRRKDNPNLYKSSITIKEYFIDSEEYLHKKI